MMSFDQLTGLADQLCPMHVIIDAEGLVVSHGPTLNKIRGDESWVGKPFLEVLVARSAE